MEVVDYDLIRRLDHHELAKHVFPDEYHGSGHNTHTGRMVCINQICEVFRNNMKLNVQIAFRKWSSSEFVRLAEPKIARESIPVVRENISKKNCCTLYCKECKAMGYCCPVAKVSFYGDLDNDVEAGAQRNCSAKVSCLYFHNSHTWKGNVSNLLGGGFCKLEMSREFIAGHTYDEAIKQGRILLHKEKGTKANSKLGKKIPGDQEYAFMYIPGETQNNRAQMLASNPHPQDWSKRLPRLTWSDLLDPVVHVSNMVRLYYCVSVQLGISRIAAPFDIHYEDKWLMGGSVPNLEHDAFMQEESILVGGFVYSGPVVCEKRHSDYDRREAFLPASAKLSGLVDGSNLFEHGFAVMMSLVESEERSMYIVHPASKMEIGKDEVLVLLGNLPRGGVTESVDRSSDKIWPALHVHMDRKGKPRKPDSLVEVPHGHGHLDQDDEPADGHLDQDVEPADSSATDTDENNGTPVVEMNVGAVTAQQGSPLEPEAPRRSNRKRKQK